MPESLEKRMEKLENDVKRLEKEDQRSKAYIAIANLMGRYRSYHTGGQNEAVGKLWAKHTPGVRAELADSGVYEGYDRVAILWDGFKNPEKGFSGAEILPIASPVIEVAKDGETARGLWTALGMNTMAGGEGIFHKSATWSVEQYACDFVKEDGTWKLWRMHLYFVMRSDYYKSWLDQDNLNFVFDIQSTLPPERKSDRPSTINIKDQMFKAGRVPFCAMTDYKPPAPEPYETYEEWMAVIPKKP
jgi:hypothetical protein